MILDLNENEWHTIVLALRYAEDARRVRDPDMRDLCKKVGGKVSESIKSIGETEYAMAQLMGASERRFNMRVVQDVPKIIDVSCEAEWAKDVPMLDREVEAAPAPARQGIRGFLSEMLFG